MKFRTTLILVVLLVAVSVFYYFDTKHVEKKEKAESDSKKIYVVAKDEITGLSIERPEQPKLTLEKRDAKWYINEPIQVEADQEAVNGMLDAIADSDRERSIEMADEPSAYGFDKPQMTVTAQLKDKGNLPALQFGAKTFSGYTVYGKLQNEEKVMVLDENTFTRLNKSLFDIRDKTLLRFVQDEVNKIQLTDAAGTLTATKTENDVWYLDDTKSIRADKNEIDKLLTAMRDLKVAEFVDQPAQPISNYGFEKPQRSMSVWIGDAGAELAVAFGAAAPQAPKDTAATDPMTPGASSERVYAKKRSDAQIVSVPAQILSQISSDRNQLRDKTVLQFDRNAVKRIETRAIPEDANAPVVCVKSEQETWELLEPQSAKADNALVNALLSNLAFMKASDCIDNVGASLEQYGLDPTSPSCEITLLEAEGKNPHKLIFSRIFGEGDTAIKYVKNPEVNTVYIISAGGAEKYCPDFNSLRNKILMDYVKKDLRRLDVKTQQSAIHIESSDGKSFEGEIEEKRDLTESEIDDLIWSFDYVEAKEILSDSPTPDVPAFGLDKPIITAIVSAEAKPEMTLLIGAHFPDKKGYAVKNASDPLIGLVDEGTFDQLFKLEVINPKSGSEDNPVNDKN